jgi:hypothetical protein
MRARLLIALVVILLLGLPAVIVLAAGPPTDAEIEKLAAGKWSQQSFEGDVEINSTTIYRKDGTFLKEGTLTKGNRMLKVTVTGRWKVSNAMLSETLEMTDPPGPPSDTQSTDAIIEINDKVLRYRTEKNVERTKTRVAD